MATLDFGQPELGIIQMAYVVEDIEASMNAWIEDLGVGPWFVLDRFTGDNPVYRGKPAQGAVKLAMAFAGHMQIELLQPLDDHRSVFREHIEARGYGFHHYGRGTRDFEAEIQAYQQKGYSLAFRAGVPTGGSVAYMDATPHLPGYVELIELGAEMEATFTRFYAASLGWDGSEPIRAFG